MTWREALRRSVKFVLAYIGVVISGMILVAMGFGMTGFGIFSGGDELDSSASGYTLYVGGLFTFVGYGWMLVGGIAIFIKLLADITSEVVAENNYNTGEMMRSLVQETRREVQPGLPTTPTVSDE